MADSDIEWTDKTWNPVRGCALVSPGCTSCYAMKFAHRFSGEGQRYEGLTRNRAKGGPVWTGVARFVPEMLDAPMRWRKPQKVFVNSMSDLFHEDITDEQIAAIFGVMAACPQHTFQVLTKRAERLPRWFEWLRRETLGDEAIGCLQFAAGHGAPITHGVVGTPWPLPNVWLGVSVEDQQRAVERIPHLLRVPAAVRFLSVEPMLGPVDLTRVVIVKSDAPDRGKPDVSIDAVRGWYGGAREDERTAIDWAIVGGESGHGARPFDLAWARSIREQCDAAGVAYFYKQGGSSHRCAHSGKGGCLDCIPADLRVREWPNAR